MMNVFVYILGLLVLAQVLEIRHSIAVTTKNDLNCFLLGYQESVGCEKNALKLVKLMFGGRHQTSKHKVSLNPLLEDQSWSSLSKHGDLDDKWEVKPVNSVSSHIATIGPWSLKATALLIGLRIPISSKVSFTGYQTYNDPGLTARVHRGMSWDKAGQPVCFVGESSQVGLRRISVNLISVQLCFEKLVMGFIPVTCYRIIKLEVVIHYSYQRVSFISGRLLSFSSYMEILIIEHPLLTNLNDVKHKTGRNLENFESIVIGLILVMLDSKFPLVEISVITHFNVLLGGGVMVFTLSSSIYSLSSLKGIFSYPLLICSPNMLCCPFEARCRCYSFMAGSNSEILPDDSDGGRDHSYNTLLEEDCTYPRLVLVREVTISTGCAGRGGLFSGIYDLKNRFKNLK